MRRIAAAAGLADEVAAIIGSGQWVDLLRVFDNQLITGGPAGLKQVAALSGFTWDVEDPGGGESMLRYDQAGGSCGAGPGESAAARDWLVMMRGPLDVRTWERSSSKSMSRTQCRRSSMPQ